MAKPQILPFPTSPADLHAKLKPLFPEEQLVQAKAWANTFVERGLMPPADQMWLLRHCFRYMPAEVVVNYLGMNVANNKPEEIEAFWVGTPPDWEGAVRMMEAAYDDAGWRAVLFPSVQPNYTAAQATRILRLIQQTSVSERREYRRLRENLFLDGFAGGRRQRASVQFWQEPQRWLAGHKLSHQEQLTVWCAYALLADPDILMKVAAGLGWKGWEVGQFLLDWDAVTDPILENRMIAAEQLWSAHNKKTTPAALPANLDFNVSM